MVADAPARAASPLRAAVFMSGAIASFSLMGVAGRELSGGHTTFQIMFWRSLVGLLIVSIAISVSTRGFAQVRTRLPGVHLLRNLGHFFGQNCWFYAVGVIPLAQVFALEFTAPVWVALAAPLFLNERFHWLRIVSAALGFLGVLMVVRPDVDGLSFGQLIALAGSIGFAVNILSTKRLTREDSTLAILFWMTVSQAIMAAVMDIAVYGSDALPMPSGPGAFWLAVVGFCGLSAHFCVTSAFRWADATMVAPMDFVRLPVIAVVGMLLYSEPLEILVFVGGAVIFLSNFLNLRAGKR